jgi:hypothetical protein
MVFYCVLKSNILLRKGEGGTYMERNCSILCYLQSDLLKNFFTHYNITFCAPVKFLRFVFLGALLYILSSPITAEAIIINYTFSGTISHSGTSIITAGSNFSGSFSIDYDAPLIYESTDFSVYDNALLNYNVSIDGHDFQAIPSQFNIQVSASGIQLVDIYGPFLDHSADVGFGFQNSNPFSNNSLSNYQYLDQMSFNSNYFYIDIFGLDVGNYQTELTGDINLITNDMNQPVPEPSTLTLLISGLSGVGGLVCRMRRKQP